MNCSPAGSSVHWISQAKILEQVFISYSRGSFGPRDWTPSPILQADSLPLHYQGSLYRSISSVQFIHSVVSNSLRPHESQHARPPCPSPTPRVHSDSRPSSQWCHPAVSSSVVPFSSCPQSLPASVFSSESTLRVRWPIGHHNLFWGGMVWIRGSMFLFYFNEF